MSSVLFLVAAVGLSILGCALFLVRQRKPTSLEHGISSFTQEMRALSPDSPVGQSRRRVRPGSSLGDGQPRR